MTVPSLRQYIHSVTFTTLPEMPANFFGIVVPADSYFNGTILINDVLTTYDWTLIYNTNGTISGYGYTTTANGNYTISHSHPNGKIYVNVYGFSHYGGYGYPAGMLLDILAVSRNSTQHVSSSFIFSNIYHTNCLSMTQSTTLITITTTTNQMTPTLTYHVTSDATTLYSTLTVQDTCTEAITTTTVTASIMASAISCDYSTVLAQVSTITVYFEHSSFTNVPVTTVICPSMLPYTTSKITPCECSSTYVTSSVTSYIVRSNLYSETVTYTSITTLTNTATSCQTFSSCYNSTIFIPVPTNTIYGFPVSSTIRSISGTYSITHPTITITVNCEEIIEPNTRDVTAVGSSMVIIIMIVSVIVGLACFMIGMYKGKRQTIPRPVGIVNPVIENVNAPQEPIFRQHNFEMVYLPEYEPDGGFNPGYAENDEGNLLP